MRRLILYINSIRYLSLRQIWFRVYYRLFFVYLKKRGLKRRVTVPESTQLKINPILKPYVSPNVDLSELKLEFINQQYSFEKSIDWNFLTFGKLWCYNLNYFDFLWVHGSGPKIGLKIIQDFISGVTVNWVGLDPYCISLRVVNWIKFLALNDIRDSDINENIYRQLIILNNSKEYHIMGNHLLENGFCLMFGAYYFKSKTFLDSAKKILLKELPKQILSDGGHYELSPMYHQIVLGRMLEVFSLTQSNPLIFGDGINIYLERYIGNMLGWINRVTFSNGEIPYVNDSAPHIGFQTRDLNIAANALNITGKSIQLGESGYRKIELSPFDSCFVEVLIDVGSVKADEQPGHSHSDVFNFIVLVNGIPFIVDTGISTYNIGQSRSIERSAQSHNTVSLKDVEPVEVWKGFRVARRPEVTVLEDSSNRVSAYHDGYKRAGVLHQRTWTFDKRSIKN